MPAKRILLAPLLVATLITLNTEAYADALGLRAGVEYWKADLSGEAQALNPKVKVQSKPINFDEWQFYGETYNSIWINFEHPVPFVPNIRMVYTNIENYKIRTRKITAGPTTYYVQESVALTFDSVDATLYYEVLDNWINLDVGITARTLKGDFESVQSIGSNLTIPVTSRTKLNEVVPMIYINGRIDIPFLDGLYVQSVFNGISQSGNTLYDTDVRVGYDFDLTVLDIGIYTGYRRMVLDTKNLGNLYADATMDGLMTGLEIHF
jgi:outer membrane protein